MKVIHFISKFGGGGLERRAIQTVKGLCGQQDIEQTIVVYSRKVEYEEALHLGVDIHYMESHGKKSVFHEINAILREKRPDIVHSWLDRFPTEHVMFSILKYRFGFKYIHGAVCDGNKIPFFSTVWVGQKISFLFADAVVSNSKAGLLAKKVPQKKSVVIYNGFDFGRIPHNYEKNKKGELGVTTMYMISMCGRIDGSKDWASYIEVAREAFASGLDATFIAIGNGDRIDEYKSVANAKGVHNIIFTGRRSDVEELIGLSDVCMLLSDSRTHVEGVSNFIMEAMASGKPVIATRGGGTPEIVNDGVNGYVVDDNINEAYGRLKMLLEDDSLRYSFGEKAKEEIKTRFSLDLMTEKYHELYTNLVHCCPLKISESSLKLL